MDQGQLDHGMFCHKDPVCQAGKPRLTSIEMPFVRWMWMDFVSPYEEQGISSRKFLSSCRQSSCRRQRQW